MKQLELFPLRVFEVEANRLVKSFTRLTEEVSKLSDEPILLKDKDPRQLPLFNN